MHLNLLFKPRKKRKGYFLIALSLVLVMLQVPVWVNMMTLEYKVRSEIKRWNEADYATGLGNSIMQAELNRLANNGPGYFAFDQTFLFPGIKDEVRGLGGTPTKSDLTVKYNFLGASVIPVPTRYVGTRAASEEYNLVVSGFDPVFADCSTTVYPDLCKNKPLEVAGQVLTDDPKYIYTVPALGTGNAGTNCEPGRIRNSIFYPTERGDSEKIPVDPLDDPCQWDEITLGQTIAIPLFILDEEDPDLVHVFDPDTLILRVRKPCIDPTQEICKGEDRWVSELEDVDSQYAINLNNRNYDYSKRFLDLAISANKFMLPNIKYDRGVGTERRYRGYGGDIENREVTEKRLMLTTTYDESYAINSESQISLINIGSIPFAEINEDKYIYSFLNHSRTDDIAGLYQYLNPSLESLVSLFDFSKSICQKLVSNCSPRFRNMGAYITGRKSEGFVPPYLLVKMINNMFEVNDPSNPDTDLDILQSVEVQLLSNKPLGNTRNAIYGKANYMDQWYFMANHKVKQKKLDVIKDTGVVFSN